MVNDSIDLNMRLKKSKNTADEELIDLLNRGYQILFWLRADFNEKKQNDLFNSANDQQNYRDIVNRWGGEVLETLKSTFPTDLESNLFLNPPHSFGAIAASTQEDYEVAKLRVRLEDLLKGLDEIRKNSLPSYTDLPIETRLYVEDIDSFAKVRDVNADKVSHFLKPGGYIDISEEKIQLGLESILNEHFHKKDSGSEYNDLYTSSLLLNAHRRATAFLLKGNGLRVKTMQIKHCGKNGDQLVRLCESPAELFIVQFVGNISESIVKDIAGKVDRLRSSGKQALYCIVNGVDTARLLHAYGLL